jgi:hypothetical protein
MISLLEKLSVYTKRFPRSTIHILEWHHEFGESEQEAKKKEEAAASASSKGHSEN